MGERRTGSDNMKFELTITNAWLNERFDKSNSEPFSSLPFVTIDENKNVNRIGYAEVNTIDELMQILDAMKESGNRQEIVIGRYNDKRFLPYIEIYNDYRE